MICVGWLGAVVCYWVVGLTGLFFDFIMIELIIRLHVGCLHGRSVLRWILRLDPRVLLCLRLRLLSSIVMVVFRGIVALTLRILLDERFLVTLGARRLIMSLTWARCWLSCI